MVAGADRKKEKWLQKCEWEVRKTLTPCSGTEAQWALEKAEGELPQDSGLWPHFSNERGGC